MALLPIAEPTQIVPLRYDESCAPGNGKSRTVVMAAAQVREASRMARDCGQAEFLQIGGSDQALSSTQIGT